MMKPTDAEIEDAARVVYTRIYNFWRYKKMLPHDVAEDLAQTGVLVGLQKLGRWRRKSSLPTFLTTIARNAGIDELRREGRQIRLKEFVKGLCEWKGLKRRERQTQI